MKDQQKLWQQLQPQGLVSGQYETPETLNSPWFVKVLLAFSGWFASILIFIFCLLALQDVIDNNIACAIIGSGFIILAYSLLKKTPNEFVEHLMLATSLAGQALIAWALFANDALSSPLISWFTLLILQGALSVLMPHYVHRVCSALFASIALIVCFHYLNISLISSTVLLFLASFLILNEWRFNKLQPLLEAISYGIVLVIIPLQASTSLGYEISSWLNEHHEAGIINHYLEQALLILVMLYILLSILHRSDSIVPLSKRIALIVATICFCLLSMQASGITVSLAILTLGFSYSNRILQGLGICSLLYYISNYYYYLELTLLQKAASLCVVGLFLLLIRGLVLKFAQPKQGAKNEA
ncbi:DUF4401 domain-containing protein [Psychromonas sp. KJ10-10]|uniref:DUF4401 domain-containing protein n=1 Tax=Psychromonas sp. KJ10-10 TaxID=3391823 RepID=UPI0039B4AA0F